MLEKLSLIYKLSAGQQNLQNSLLHYVTKYLYLKACMDMKKMYYHKKQNKNIIFNRPGVAGAVLTTFSQLTD